MIQVASIIDGLPDRPPASPRHSHLFTPVFHAPSTFMGYPDVTSFLQAWLPIVFMGALVIGVFALMRFMPRTRPAEIKPDSAPPIAWADIAGAEEAKEELREVVDYLRDPARFRDLGAKVPKGILLHGPPGTGKTLLAKAVAHESGATFFSQSAASFVEMFVGVGAARIRHLFKSARKKAPAIVFIDELDAVGGHRGFDVSGERDQTLNQLLVEMDGFTSRKDVVVIAASNLLEKLDPALLRPGRFDRQIFVSPPDVIGRERILHVHSRNKPLGDGVDLNLLARQTSGLTGADLANICNEAAIFAGRRRADRVEMRDFDAALERVIAGMQSRRTLTDHEKRVVAYHEAGHALCGELPAERRPRPPDLDRSARPRARLHAEPPRGGPLPEDARGADRLHDDAAGRPGRRAARVRLDHHRRLGRPQARRRDRPLDGPRIRDGHWLELAARDRQRRRRGHPPRPRRRGTRAGGRGLPRRPVDRGPPPGPARRARGTLLTKEVLERPDIDRIMGDVPRAAPQRIGELSVAAATAVKPATSPARQGPPRDA